MLVRLLYASRAAEPVTNELVESILHKSHEHNPALGITGVLCYGGDVYMQVLEGGRSAVNNLYNTIVRDARHREVMLLQYREIAERRVAGWTMGHVSLKKINPSLLLKHSELPVLDPFSVPAAASMALLEDLIATASVLGRSG